VAVDSSQNLTSSRAGGHTVQATRFFCPLIRVEVVKSCNFGALMVVLYRTAVAADAAAAAPAAADLIWKE
jgi:hypothetical protein